MPTLSVANLLHARFDDREVSIMSAPKDGSMIYLVRPNDGKLFESTWDQNGNSLVDGQLMDTGAWFCSVGGWFEPNEVSFWMSKEVVEAHDELLARVCL